MDLWQSSWLKFNCGVSIKSMNSYHRLRAEQGKYDGLLTLSAMLMLVLWPLLLPAVIHGSDAIANRRRKSPVVGATARRQMLANSHAA